MLPEPARNGTRRLAVRVGNAVLVYSAGIIQSLMPALIALLLLAAPLVRAQTLDDAARVLARKIAAHLEAGMVVKVAPRNLSSMSSADFARAQAALERALRRRFTKQAPVAEVKFTVSENPREFLLVAEIQRSGERSVEMVAYHAEAPAKPVLPVLERRLLWEQNEAMLDVAMMDDRLLVLDIAKVTLLERRAGKWEPAGSVALDTPPLRDPRGRLEVNSSVLDVFLPGVSCHGTWKPALELTCDSRPAEFALSGERVHFVPGRNTFELNGWPACYSFAKLDQGAKSLLVFGEADLRAHLYDSERRPLNVLDEWSGDFVQVCETRILAQRGPGMAAYTIADRKAVEASASLDFPGSITALWPAPGGALVIIRNNNGGKYAAYSLTLDCGR